MKRIKLWQDSDTESPRSEDWEQSCTMLSCHTRYALEDKGARSKLIDEIRASKKHSDNLEMEYDINSLPSLLELAIKVDIIAAHLPLHIHDHGSITISTIDFNIQFDSGQYGFAYITKDEAYEMLSIKRITEKSITRLEEIIKEEVDVFDQYLRDEIYGFTLVDDDGNDGDSCGGFYTHNIETNGMKEHIDEKYHSLLKNAEVEYD